MSLPAREAEPQPLSAQEFVTRALAHLERGYEPLPVGQRDNKGRYKSPWIGGHHGYGHQSGSPDTINSWPALVDDRIRDGKSGILALGLVLPPDVVGIDVDGYDGKPGLATLKSWADDLGELPDTYMVTARMDGSGIRLYRKPDDWEAQEQRGSGIEFIDHNHRYIIAPGSWHHTGNRYRLRTPEGKARKSGILPLPADLRELPPAYLDRFKRPTKAGSGLTASRAEIEQFAQQHTASRAPSYLDPVLRDYRSDLGESLDNTHGPIFSVLCRIARESRAGAYSFKPAVREVRKLAERHYADRDRPFDRADFLRMVGDAVGAANAENLADLKARVFRDYGTDTRKAAEVSTEENWWDDLDTDDDQPVDLTPSEFEIDGAARKILLRRAAEQRVKEIEATRLLELSSAQVFNGVSFLEDVQPGDPVWGSGKTVAWAKNQGFMVFGSDGTGKSTVLQQVGVCCTIR